MMILFSGNLSGYIWFPDFFRIFRISWNLQISSQNRWFTSLMWYDDFVSGYLSGYITGFCIFIRNFIRSSDFFTQSMVYFSYVIWWFTGYISGFRIFSRIYPDFQDIFRFLHTINGLLLLCDMMIYFPIYIQFLDFFRIFIKSSDFLTKSMVLFLGKITQFLDFFPICQIVRL